MSVQNHLGNSCLLLVLGCDSAPPTPFSAGTEPPHLCPAACSPQLHLLSAWIRNGEAPVRIEDGLIQTKAKWLMGEQRGVETRRETPTLLSVEGGSGPQTVRDGGIP